MIVDAYNFNESECAILDLIERKMIETMEDRLVILPKLEVDSIEGGEEALYELQRRMLIERLTSFENRDGLSKWHTNDIDKWMGPKFLYEIITNGGGYIFIIAKTLLEDWDHIAKAKKRCERIKRSGGIWYELTYSEDSNNLMLLNHCDGLAKILYKTHTNSDIEVILKLLSRNPNKILTLEDIKKEKPGMTKNIVQALSGIEGIMNCKELKQMFFPIFSNDKVLLSPKIRGNEVIPLSQNTIKYLSSKNKSHGDMPQEECYALVLKESVF